MKPTWKLFKPDSVDRGSVITLLPIPGCWHSITGDRPVCLRSSLTFASATRLSRPDLSLQRHAVDSLENLLNQTVVLEATRSAQLDQWLLILAAKFRLWRLLISQSRSMALNFGCKVSALALAHQSVAISFC
jgi:hypothetical protein